MDGQRQTRRELDLEDSLIGSAAEDVGPELLDPPEEAVPAVGPHWRSRQGAWMVGVALVIVLLGVAWWRSATRDSLVPLAVPASAAAAAGQAASRAGVDVRWQDGHPWVPSSQSARAAQAATLALSAARGGTGSPAAADDGLFLSAEAARARRLAATAAALEQMIEAQAGVERARLVLAEGARAGAPGSAYAGPTAAATITVTTGEMSQDLVDAVAALVSGAVPGLAPERVAVIDANANRQRVPRAQGERIAADARREQERALAERVRTAVSGAADVRVAIEDGPDARVRAVVVLGVEHAQRVAAASKLPPDIALATEEARVIALAETLLPAGTDGVPAMVVVTHALDPVGGAREERTPSAVALGEPIAAAIERERLMPLGAAAPAAGSWDAGMLALLVLGLGAAAAAVAYLQRRSARTPALAGGALDLFAESPHSPSRPRHRAAGPALEPLDDAQDASDAVRADPEHAVAVMRGWLDAGFDLRAAHVVVALDSGAAGALLRAMPAPLVHRITAALAALDTPSVHDLRDASAALVEEITLAHASGAGDAAHEDAL